MFSCEFCEFSKNTFLAEYFWTAFVDYKALWLYYWLLLKTRLRLLDLDPEKPWTQKNPNLEKLDHEIRGKQLDTEDQIV